MRVYFSLNVLLSVYLASRSAEIRWAKWRWPWWPLWLRAPWLWWDGFEGLPLATAKMVAAKKSWKKRIFFTEPQNFKKSFYQK